MNKATLTCCALMLWLLLIATGCSSDREVDTATSVDQGPVASSETPGTADASPELGRVEEPQPSTPDPSVNLDVDAEIDIDLGPRGIFADAAAALEALTSYRFTTSFVFTHEDAGEFESGSIELTGAIVDARHKHVTWKDLDEGDYFEVIQIGDEAWVLDADGEWDRVPALVADAMSQAVLVFAPSVVWGGLFGTLGEDAAYVGSEVVDGVLAHHYTSTHQQWAGYWQGELLDAAGDVWIADAGYPLRYDFTATAIDEEGNRGTVSWTMRLSAVEGGIVIEPPM
jgi:hypothetical protein